MDAKACKRNEYRDPKTRRCRKLPLKIKNWEMERHEELKRLGEVDYWRNQEDKGWVDIARVEPGAPVWGRGKNRYGLHMNTPRKLKSEYFRKLEDARGIAVQWMKKYPNV